MFICSHKVMKHKIKSLILLFLSNDQAPQRSPLMVITPGHSRPILSTGFERDFSLTLGFCWTTFSFSLLPLLFICHFGGPAEQLLKKLLRSFHYLGNLY